MRSTRWTAAALGAAAWLGSGWAAMPARAAADDVKLAGCLVKAESGDGYLLINAPREPVALTDQPRTATPGTVGTTGEVANIFYWLNDDGDLKRHIGHQVEIQGDLKGKLEDGQITLDRKAQWTELRVTSDGKSMKARVPNASVVAGPGADRKLAVFVRRVDVDKVTMLDAACR